MRTVFPAAVNSILNTGLVELAVDLVVFSHHLAEIEISALLSGGLVVLSVIRRECPQV
jgi:hypothetical protein